MSLFKKHYYLFYLFILTFPFNIRKVFLSGYSYFTGHFVEDATYFLNLSDIFLILVVVCGGLFILRSKLQNDFVSFVRRYRYFFYILAALIVWSFLGIFYAKDKSLVLFGTAKMLEFSLLFFYSIYFLRDWKKLFTSLNLIVIGGVVQSIIAVFQYLNQSSIGLKILGESIIGKDLPGVAKILIDGEKIVRPYGTFGHPNILGGFLVFSLAVSLMLFLLAREGDRKLIVRILTLLLIVFFIIMFFDHYLLTNQQGQIILWTILGMVFAVSISHFEKWGLGRILGDRAFGGRTYEWWILPFIILQFIALILTYSRSAWLVFGFIVIGITVFSFKKNIWKSWLKILAVLSVIILVLFLFLPFKNRINESLNFSNQAISDRVLGIKTVLKIIKTNPLVGLGNKNYVISITDYEINKLEYWQYQPVHNGYLLIISELGFVGFGFFAIFTFFVAAHNFIFSRKC